MEATDQTITVSYNQTILHIPILPLSLTSFIHRTKTAFNISPPYSSRLQLAFETINGHLTGVTSRFALQLIICADLNAGRLVLDTSRKVCTVDNCILTVLQNLVDTAVGGEAAAVFSALFGAWEAAARKFGDYDFCTGDSTGHEGGGEKIRCILRETLERGLEGRVDADLGRGMAELAVQGFEYGGTWEKELVAVELVLQGFTRHDVWCEGCGEQIIGTLFRGEDNGNYIFLCEGCRRSVEYGERNFLVYEHPWECGKEYEGGEYLNAPRPPLRVGDVGGRVTHLQFLLYKSGCLGVGRGFKIGVYCRSTEEALGRLKRELGIDEMGYGSVTKRVLGNLFEQVERGVGVGFGGANRGRRHLDRTRMGA